MEPGIWVYGSGRVCGKHFLCRNAASGTEAEKLLEKPGKRRKGFTPGEIVMIVFVFC